jgi:hypothetical protein
MPSRSLELLRSIAAWEKERAMLLRKYSIKKKATELGLSEGAFRNLAYRIRNGLVKKLSRD